MNNKIFIQIASYRDPELVPTIKDCIANAKNPENLVFCIAWQHDEKESLGEYRNDPRFIIIDIPYQDSKGACWARNLIQYHYNDEGYTLQLDSHHRFIKNWDAELIKMVKGLQKKGHKKPLITGYIPSYDPANDPESRVKEPWKMDFDRFIPEGAVFFLPSTIQNHEKLKSPIPARFYSAHFCFTLGQFCKEVQHDSDYYFHGEEISIAVRAFTWGYDLFHSHKVIAWHEYTRKGRTKQWDDDKKWCERNNYCHLKNRKLFEMDGEKRDIDFGRYGFGKERSLHDYEAYSGLRFSDRGVQQYTLDNNIAPNPKIKDSEEYDKSFLTIFKHCIDVGFDSVPYTDYDVWVVTFEDKDGNEIFREDIGNEEITRIKNDPDGYCKVWKSFNTKIKPYKWLVWPHSIEHGWCDKMTGTLY